MARKRTLVIVLAVLLLLPVVLVGGLLVAAQSEWGERFVERRASAALGRAVEIDGISIKLGWPPRVGFDHLRIANPDWAETPDLINARGLYARVHVPPLFAKRVVIPYLGASQARAGLEMDGKRATWRFSAEAEEKEDSGLVLGLVHVADGDIRFIDKGQATDLAVKVKGSAGEGGELQAQAEGRFRGEATKVQATIPELSTQHEAPVRIAAKGNVGRTQATVDGALATDGKSMDVKLQLAGQTFKDLSKVTGIVLPDSPPYRIQGDLRHEGSDWNFSPFQGRVGDSDLRGSVLYRKAGKKPFLQAKLESNLLDFDDLGPLIGAPPKTGAGETAAPEQEGKARQVKASTKVLPEQEFGTKAWGRMDADVYLKAKRVQRPKALPIESLDTHLVLKDSVVHLKPLNFGFAGGRITSDVKLDANKKPLEGVMKVDVQGLKLGRLFPENKTMQDAMGTMYGRAELVGHGTSVASLLGTSDGKASLAVDGGRISALLVELIGLDVAESLMLLGRKHQQVELRCAVSGFEVKEGSFQADSFVVDTSDTVVKVEGAINLKDERLDLETKPYPKDPSPLALRTPLNIKGPFKDPSILPQPGRLAARAAGAAALGAISPPLALLALIETGPGKDTDCSRLLAEAKSKGAVKTAG
jgi:AsmA family protein